MRLKTAVPMLMLLLLCACGADNPTAQTPATLRTDLAAAGGCTFTLSLRADYGDYVRDYDLACSFRDREAAELEVISPEMAAGVRATVSGEDAFVRYEDTVLAVEEFSSRKISPMAAPWLLGEAWSRGHIASTGRNGDRSEVRYLVGYGKRQLEVTCYFRDGIPVEAEIADGERVLITCTIKDFNVGKLANDHEQQNAQENLGGGES